ncbi:uncharacterized protein PAC_03641 [Phialocephala subalpina]|uniref:Thioesterase domain-containing protein n=1 Tax=Phialocephala subalpina TaxID=576137 RepID=A0A1L7WLX8_9HELO|nr:uncharacterized protein PAC_03641 [Phialocephala subalpina]
MAHPAAEREKAMKAVEAIFERYLLIAKSTSFQGFDAHIMSTVKLLNASMDGTVDFEFLIDERYTNINGVMHGGAAGVIFDMCTTTALGPLAKPGFWEIHSEVTQVGKTMAMIRGTMTSQDGKTIYCTCEHHKVAVPTQPKHLEHKVPWDELWVKDGKAKL